MAAILHPSSRKSFAWLLQHEHKFKLILPTHPIPTTVLYSFLNYCTAQHAPQLTSTISVPCGLYVICPRLGLYPGGGVGVGQAGGVEPGCESVVRVQVGHPHQRVWDHGDGIGGHQRDVVW